MPVTMKEKPPTISVIVVAKSGIGNRSGFGWPGGKHSPRGARIEVAEKYLAATTRYDRKDPRLVVDRALVRADEFAAGVVRADRDGHPICAEPTPFLQEMEANRREAFNAGKAG